jgi:hypothetical protein
MLWGTCTATSADRVRRSPLRQGGITDPLAGALPLKLAANGIPSDLADCAISTLTFLPRLPKAEAARSEIGLRTQRRDKANEKTCAQKRPNQHDHILSRFGSIAFARARAARSVRFGFPANGGGLVAAKMRAIH